MNQIKDDLKRQAEEFLNQEKVSYDEWQYQYFFFKNPDFPKEAPEDQMRFQYVNYRKECMKKVDFDEIEAQVFRTAYIRGVENTYQVFKEAFNIVEKELLSR